MVVKVYMVLSMQRIMVVPLTVPMRPQVMQQVVTTVLKPLI